MPFSKASKTYTTCSDKKQAQRAEQMGTPSAPLHFPSNSVTGRISYPYSAALPDAATGSA